MRVCINSCVLTKLNRSNIAECDSYVLNNVICIVLAGS